MAIDNFEFVVSKVHKTKYKGGHSFVVTRLTIVLQPGGILPLITVSVPPVLVLALNN